MTDTDIAERLRTLIDTSAPAVSADDVINPRVVPPSGWQPAKPGRTTELRPLLVLAYSAMAVVLIVAIILGFTLTGKPGSRLRMVLPASTQLRGAHFADLAATPLGWSPIAFGNVQVSVPSDWVEYPDTGCGNGPLVFLALPASARGCSDASSEVSITIHAMPTNAGQPIYERGVVHGIPVNIVVPATDADYDEYALGMEIDARGPFAKEIAGTLTYSPAYAIFHSSGNEPAASGWQTISFGGISFQAPSEWTVEHESTWGGGCGRGIQSGVVTLSTAKRSIVEKCVESLSEASSWVAVPGIVVGDGPAIANGSPDTSGDTCESRNRLRICIESGVAGLEEPWIQTNLLTALAFVPNQQRPDQVEVGLNGSGETPLMIFDSMRATSS